MSELLCPICKSQLGAMQTLDITIDKCPFCDGIWFDAGELETYCTIRGKSDSVNPFAGAAFERDDKHGRRHCPRCRSDSLQFGSLAVYDVWRCDDCRGYFVFSATIDEFIPMTSGQKALSGLAGLLELLTAGL